MALAAWIARPALLVALVAAAGCNPNQETGIRVTVTFPEELGVDQLALDLAPSGAATTRRLLVPSVASETIASGARVLVLVPDDWGGKTAELEVRGLKQGATPQGQEQGRGKGQVAVVAGAVVDVTVALVAVDPGCTDECPAGETQCIDDGGNAGYQLCGEHDSDSCRDWGPVLGCGAKELCLEGACVPECGGKPCSCTPGASATCAAVGECQGGERVCKSDGTYTGCEWQTGPRPEVCDGKDNDCDGQTDGPGICCQPSCGARVCGPDPVCGTSCGPACPAPKTCSSQGQCVAPATCTPVGPVVVDGQGDVGDSASLALDGAGKVHISYRDEANKSLKYVTNAAGSWQSVVVDAQGGGYYSSLKLDQAAKAHIAYYAGLQLRYATNVAGSWKAITLDAQGAIGAWASLGLDSAGKVHIAYYNGSPSYATNAWASASQTWYATVIDVGGNVGPFTSLAIDGADHVYVSYYDSGNKDLKCASNASGSWKSAIAAEQGDVGQHSSLAVDAAGKAHISYYDASTGVLKYVTNASALWKGATVNQPGVVGWYSSLALDKAGKVHISYFDVTNQNLKYATNAAGAWKSVTLDEPGDVGRQSSLAVDGAGKVHVAYFDATNKDLKYLAHCP